MNVNEHTHEAAQRIFVSYSRSEMYYAEAVVLHLQRAGYEVWFDLQQLEPGCVWKDEIDRGLDWSTEVLLIASQSALQSYWVGHEWQHALENDKPVTIIAFEDISFEPITIHMDDKRHQLDLPVLKAQARSIIDGRTDFNGTMLRLTRTLNGTEDIKEEIPLPNRFGISSRMPLTVALVAGMLGLGVLTMLWLTLIGAAIYAPLAIGGIILTGIVARELREFLTRSSYRGARLSLFILALWSLLIQPVLALLFVMGALISVYAADVNRWSPRGEGVKRANDLRGNLMWESAFGVRDLLLGIYRWYRNWLLWLHILILIVLSLPLLLILLAGDVPAAERLPTVAYASIFILVQLAIMYDRRRAQVRLERSTGKTGTGLTFRVLAAFEDSNIAARVTTAMREAGHRQHRAREDDTPDIMILVATNRLRASHIERFDTSQGRWIVLVASQLESSDWFERLESFQWVDYRRQDSEQLQNMIDDLKRTDYDIVSHAFSTRTVPQSFQKLLTPRRVQLYIFLQLFGLNASLAFYIRVLTTEARFDPIMGPSAVVGVISAVLGFWLVMRIIRREITIDSIMLLNVAMVASASLIGVFVGLTQIPSYARVDWGFVLQYLFFQAIGLVIGYFIGRIFLRWWLGDWLPLEFTDNLPAWTWLKDRQIVLRNVVMAFIVILVAMSVTTGPIERRIADVPTEEVPVAGLLRQTNTPIGNSLANFIDESSGVNPRRNF